MSRKGKWALACPSPKLICRLKNLRWRCASSSDASASARKREWAPKRWRQSFARKRMSADTSVWAQRKIENMRRQVSVGVRMRMSAGVGANTRMSPDGLTSSRDCESGLCPDASRTTKWMCAHTAPMHVGAEPLRVRTTKMMCAPTAPTRWHQHKNGCWRCVRVVHRCVATRKKMRAARCCGATPFRRCFQ